MEDVRNPSASVPSVAVRRFGYVVAILVNVAILIAINAWPGWQAVPFLTEDMPRVVRWVNASIAVGVVVNFVYLVADPPAVRALGDVVTAAAGIVPLVLLWQVFPFDFPVGFDWSLVARIFLGFGIFGSVVAVIVGLVAFVRALTSRFHGVAAPGGGRSDDVVGV